MLLNIWSIFLIIQLVPHSLCQNFYDDDPNIIELTSKNFDKVIHRTNYTTVVEFYAPWCGYCQQLKGTMKKLAKSLDEIVQVATVNCDLAKNKQLCAQQQIDGFPTIMVFRPPKIDFSKPDWQHTTPKIHASEVYKGKRKLTAMVDFALSRMKSYVKRLTGPRKFLAVLKNSPKKKLFLFSHRDDVSPIYRSIALDWLEEFESFFIPNQKLSSIPEDSKLRLSHPNIFATLQSLLPDQINSKKSLLVAVDPTTDQIYVYNGDSLTKRPIARFLVENLKTKPREGPLSKRVDFLDYLKGRKKASGSKSNTKDSNQSINDEL